MTDAEHAAQFTHVLIVEGIKLVLWAFSIATFIALFGLWWTP